MDRGSVMSVRPITYYQIVCDHPGCDFDSAGFDETEFGAYVEGQSALKDWEHYGGWLGPAGATLCPDHRPPRQCSDCEGFGADVDADLDDDLFCAICAEHRSLISRS